LPVCSGKLTCNMFVAAIELNSFWFCYAHKFVVHA
jgi:hypothetical protein